MDQQILRIPRVDVAESFVLAHVTRTGSLPLDVKIEATEGESPYVGHLEESADNLGEPTRSYCGSAGEWKTVLAHGLSLQGTDPQEREITGALETVAQIEPGKMIIVIRQNIAGITVDKLQAQLDDLVKSKEEHEEALLNKFRQLLNSKKLKIRDQQRLLAGARIDPDTAAQVQQSRSADRQRKTTASRKGKRRAAAIDEEMDLEGNGGDASIDEDQRATHGEDDRINTATPDRSDVGTTEDEAEEEDEGEEAAEGFAPIPASADTHVQTRGPEAESKATEVRSKETSQRLDLPPLRNPLPFQQRDQQVTQNQPDQTQKRGATQGREDEDTTDDEL
ncbi:MAG: hypothetical protein Q9165_000132 [Trypethelium subeluteriae]